MSGFSGGSGRMVGDLVRQVQGQQGQGQGQPPATQPTAQPQSMGPGEPQSQYTGGYNQQGVYNTLATDMSRGRMGGFGFGGNQFNYQPFGNPYMNMSPFGGYRQPYQPTQPPIMGGGMYGMGGGFGNVGHPGLRNRMQNAYGAGNSAMGYIQPSSGGMGGGYGGMGYGGGMGGGYGGMGYGGGFGRARMF